MAIHTPVAQPATTPQMAGLGWVAAAIVGIVILTAALLIALPAGGPTSIDADRGLDHSGLRGDYQLIMGEERGYEGSGLRR